MDGMTSRLDTLQALRAVAALLVAAFHLHAATMKEIGASGAFVVFQRGEIGVDLFFVLSGFIITWSALQKPDLTARRFLAARFWRVVPPYWAALILYLLAFVGLAVTTGDTTRLPDGAGMITSLLLMPLPDQVVIVAWSLTLEVVFYGLFALTWFRADKRLFVVALCIWAVFALIAEQTDHSATFGLVLHPSVPEFLLGVVVAWMIARGIYHGQRIAFAIGGILFALGVAGTLDPIEQIVGRSIAYGVPAALLIYGANGLHWVLPRWLLTLGDASYALYLLHLLVFYVMGRGVEMLTGFNVYASPTAMLGMLVIATLLACAVHIMVERPYQRWYTARSKRVRAASPGVLTPAR